jgi:hypothetical protein
MILNFVTLYGNCRIKPLKVCYLQSNNLSFTFTVDISFMYLKHRQNIDSVSVRGQPRVCRWDHHYCGYLPRNLNVQLYALIKWGHHYCGYLPRNLNVQLYALIKWGHHYCGYLPWNLNVQLYALIKWGHHYCGYLPRNLNVLLYTVYY